MRVNALPALVGSLALARSSLAANIISSNDDGWAEVNIRALFDTLTEADHSVVVSAPAENQSGTGSLNLYLPPDSTTVANLYPTGSSSRTPTTLDEACEFNSCPSGSPAVGHNASEPRLNYVNSYPVTSMKYGINSIGPQFFDGLPDLAVAGPNVSHRSTIHTESVTDLRRLVQISESLFTSPGRLEQLHMRRTMLAFLPSHFLERLALRQLGTHLRPIPIIVRSMRMRLPTSPTTLSRPGNLTFQMMYVIHTLLQ